MEIKTELEKNALTVAHRKDLESDQRALNIQWLNNRMEDVRMGRCLALIQQEAKMEKDYHERTDHAAIVNKRAETDTKLGLEIAKQERYEATELLKRHYIRETDPTLRELCKKLQAGYVCRHLKQQILHNEYKRLEEKLKQQQGDNLVRKALYIDQEALHAEERGKIERTVAYCKELQQQLVNKQRQKQCQYEDTLIEKKMLDDIMRTISEEDHRELQMKRASAERLRSEMEAFRKAREAWRLKQKQLVILEEQEIEKEQKQAADRSAAITAERLRNLELKEEMSQKIAEKILADEADRMERENIIKLLQEQEYIEKNVQDDASEREKLERVKRETKHALSSQMEHKRRLAEEEKKKEVEFRKIAEVKMSAQEEEEREKQRKVRQKNREYSLALKKQMEEDARRRNTNRRDEEDRAKYVFEYDKNRREEVNRERSKIIEEHVPNLLGYLRAGVLKKDDLSSLREGIEKKPELAELDIEAMAVSGGAQRFAKCKSQCRILKEY